MKIILVLITFFFCSNLCLSQSSTKENIYTSLKPADGKPVVFNSQEELNAKIESKKNNVITLIKDNASDTGQVRLLREQLWRFENAVVKKAGTK